MEAIRVLAPAKVNLILQVLGKREDGYHELRSLMQQVSLYDELILSREGRGTIRIDCDAEGIPRDERNLAWRAADLLLQRSGRGSGIRITIRKRIPAAAGLGGGSSDAASTLMGLNELLGLHRSRRELMEWGAALGADVPFFLFGSPALATGIGERLQRVDFGFELWYLLAPLPFEVSTGWAYGQFRPGLTEGRFHSTISTSFEGLETLLKGLENDLETVTEKAYPAISEAKAALLRSGARGALMTGSGPTVFGVFPDRESAIKARRRVLSEGKEGPLFLVEGIVA